VKPEHAEAIARLRAELATAAYAAECMDTSNDLRRANDIRSQAEALDAALAEIEQAKRDAVELYRAWVAMDGFADIDNELETRLASYVRPEPGR
jgi:hypothetical protein